MTIWLDAQLPPKLADYLNYRFNVKAIAVRDLGLRDASDMEIFSKAKEADAVIMTKNSDFIDLYFRFGAPPKIIIINCGNVTNQFLQIFLQDRFPEALKLLENTAIVEIG